MTFKAGRSNKRPLEAFIDRIVLRVLGGELLIDHGKISDTRESTCLSDSINAG